MFTFESIFLGRDIDFWLIPISWECKAITMMSERRRESRSNTVHGHHVIRGIEAHEINAITDCFLIQLHVLRIGFASCSSSYCMIRCIRNQSSKVRARRLICREIECHKELQIESTVNILNHRIRMHDKLHTIKLHLSHNRFLPWRTDLLLRSVQVRNRVLTHFQLTKQFLAYTRLRKRVHFEL